jgi:hypothetical protein
MLMMSILLTSCFKKDPIIPRHPRGDVKTDTISMSQDYKYQVYFDLGTGTAVSTNIKTVSDLAFECSQDGWHVILNTGDFMKVADLGIVTFGQAQDTSHVTWKFDKSDGNTDSVAIGRWYTVINSDTVSNGHVYAVDRGMDEAGNILGFRQVIFDSLRNGTYYFRYAPITGGAVTQASVTKDPAVNYLYFSFSNGGEVKHLEPSMDSWDLLFTQYTTLLYTDEGEAYPYLVTGVLSNRNDVRVAMDTTHSFENLTLEMAQGANYSTALDAIGYDWKKYDFDAGTYTVRLNLNYFIRDNQGFYYKLRFIGFINAQGNKGYPVIEYVGL